MRFSQNFIFFKIQSLNKRPLFGGTGFKLYILGRCFGNPSKGLLSHFLEPAFFLNNMKDAH